jgi:cytochrome c
MKPVLMSAIVVSALLSAGMAHASAELNKSAGCARCHEVDKKKKAESYKDISARYKGKADAEATVLKTITDPNGDHPPMKAKPDEIATMVKWILTQ